MVTEKICSRCKTLKPASQFRKRADKRIGIQSACKECSRKMERDRYNSKKNVPVQSEGSRVCTLCNFAYPVSFFTRSASKSGGRMSRCKNCIARLAAEKRASNYEAYKNWQKDYRHRHVDKLRQREVDRWAKKPEDEKKAIWAKRSQWLKDNPDKVLDFYLRRTYKITLEDYNFMLVSQNFKCAVCQVEAGSQRATWGVKRSELNPFCIDHCHEDGRVRGLLCQSCNTGLGAFGDRIEWLIGAIEYLGRGAGNVS